MGLGAESSETSRESGQVDKVERLSRQKEMHVHSCRAETSNHQSGQPGRVGPSGAMKEAAPRRLGNRGGLWRLGSLSAWEKVVQVFVLDSSLCGLLGKRKTEDSDPRKAPTAHLCILHQL